MISAKQFYNDYVTAITKEYWEAYHDNSRWTECITRIIRAQIENYGLESQTEYFRIDITGWNSRWDSIKAEAHKVGLNPHLWDLKIAVEHENDSSDWSDELVKLAHIRCPLKVIIGYTPCDQRDAGGKEDERLAFAANVLQMVEAFDPASKEEILVILGNSAPRKSSNPQYTDFGYRGYVFDYERGVFRRV